MKTPEPAKGGAMLTRTALANCIEEIAKARAIVSTVWLALSSGNLDSSDADDLRQTLYEGIRILEGCYKVSNEANEAEIRSAIERGAAR